MTNLTLWNPWGYITDISKCHDAGMWIMDQNIFRFMFKNIAHLAACSGPLADSRRAARGARISETHLLHFHFNMKTSCY